MTLIEKLNAALAEINDINAKYHEMVDPVAALQAATARATAAAGELAADIHVRVAALEQDGLPLPAKERMVDLENTVASLGSDVAQLAETVRAMSTPAGDALPAEVSGNGNDGIAGATGNDSGPG